MSDEWKVSFSGKRKNLQIQSQRIVKATNKSKRVKLYISVYLKMKLKYFSIFDFVVLKIFIQKLPQSTLNEIWYFAGFDNLSPFLYSSKSFIWSECDFYF